VGGSLLDDYHLLISDSSVLFRFFQAGASCTEKMMDFCAARLHIVDSVAEEIHDHRNDPDKSDGIAAFEAKRVNEPLESPLSVANKVQQARDLNRKYGLGAADIGEMETVFYADWAWEQGGEYLILMGDREGQRLAADHDLEHLDSHSFAMELVCRQVLTVEEGELVASKIFGAAFDRSIYHTNLRAGCPEVLGEVAPEETDGARNERTED
jgi:hypothetical protein